MSFMSSMMTVMPVTVSMSMCVVVLVTMSVLVLMLLFCGRHALLFLIFYLLHQLVQRFVQYGAFGMATVRTMAVFGLSFSVSWSTVTTMCMLDAVKESVVTAMARVPVKDLLK